MKRRLDLTPEEQLWQQVWRVWPNAMQYEQVDTPFDAPSRVTATAVVERSRVWLQNKHARQIER